MTAGSRNDRTELITTCVFFVVLVSAFFIRTMCNFPTLLGDVAGEIGMLARSIAAFSSLCNVMGHGRSLRKINYCFFYYQTIIKSGIILIMDKFDLSVY